MLHLALAAVLPLPVDLDGVTFERARALAGRVVVASFLVAKPLVVWKGRTLCGAADRDDGAERVAVLRGVRLDVKEGHRLAAVGVLRAIGHGPHTVNGVFVPAWVELRVDGFGK